MVSESYSQNLANALKNHEIRRACTAIEHILHAAEILDNLPPSALEEIRDYCDDCVKDRTGAFSDFKRAYIKLVADHLSDARVRERKLVQAITGKDVQEKTEQATT
jgi:hypothetical protein